MCLRLSLACALAASTAAVAQILTEEASPLVGDSIALYRLAPENDDVRGLALDETSSQAPRLLVLDGSGALFLYRAPAATAPGAEPLALLGTLSLPKDGDDALAGPRGLAYAREGESDVAYFLNWARSESDAVVSQLWRMDLGTGESRSANLTVSFLRIGDREVFGVCEEGGDLLISFDATGYLDNNLRVSRGIARYARDPSAEEGMRFVRHMPDSGRLPSQGIAAMEMDGRRYLWATVGDDSLYCAEAATGRGFLQFPCPRSRDDSDSCHGLCFGLGDLWVAECGPEADVVHRVNVTRNPYTRREGPRIPRRLIMTIDGEPAPDSAVEDPGKVHHYYSRPYAYEQLGNQGIWPDSECVTDTSDAPNAAVGAFTYDPAGDASARQHMAVVEYASAPQRPYSSRYEIDIWTNSYHEYVYPHLARRDASPLAATDYLADDDTLYNLSDTATYDAFLARVSEHIQAKYGAPADMENPYWAARNVVEYMQDNYYYPDRERRKPATVDYDRGHYDANPANLKMELSDHPYDQTQIIACSGSSVMVVGAMRYLGVPARWLGTSTPMGPSEWDDNGNGVLDPDETAPCTNGHRYAQVWLGPDYGWTCFDATPGGPDQNDFDPPPPLQSQSRYMERAAGGHGVNGRRIVLNVGSGLFAPLYREYKWDERLARDNNCGGDQRYNLRARFENPDLWELPSLRISVRNPCSIPSVAVSGREEAARVQWTLGGEWDLIPDATVSVALQRVDRQTGRGMDVAVVARDVPYAARSVTVDISRYAGKGYRIAVRRDGDSQTAGFTEPFDLRS